MRSIAATEPHTIHHHHPCVAAFLRCVRTVLVVAVFVVFVFFCWSIAASPILRTMLGERLHEPLFVAEIILLCFICNLTAVLDPVALPIEVIIVGALGGTGVAIIAVEHFCVKIACFALGRSCLRDAVQSRIVHRQTFRAVDLALQVQHPAQNG
jgi:hypothetical protein